MNNFKKNNIFWETYTININNSLIITKSVIFFNLTIYYMEHKSRS